MNITVITTGESDTFLAQYVDWLVLTAPDKAAHIAKASVYAQTQWTCVDDVVWEDDPDTVDVEIVDIPDEIKEAVAYYAYADYHGNLYGDPSSTEEKHGGLRSNMEKVGDLATEVQYFQGGTQTETGNRSVTGYANALMGVYCELCGLGSTSLVRV